MKSIECWRWRYRDSGDDRVWRTTLALTEEEAAKYPGAQHFVVRNMEEARIAWMDDVLSRAGPFPAGA